MVDVDWYGEDGQLRRRYVIDEARAAANGVTADLLARPLQLVAARPPAGWLYDPVSREDNPLQIRLDRAARSRAETFLSLRVKGVALGDIVTVEESLAGKAIYIPNVGQAGTIPVAQNANVFPGLVDGGFGDGFSGDGGTDGREFCSGSGPTSAGTPRLQRLN